MKSTATMPTPVIGDGLAIVAIAVLLCTCNGSGATTDGSIGTGAGGAGGTGGVTGTGGDASGGSGGVGGGGGGAGSGGAGGLGGGGGSGGAGGRGGGAGGADGGAGGGGGAALCGARACTSGEICVRPSCGGAPPPCNPVPDGGQCPAGWVFRPFCTVTSAPGCEPAPCTPPASYCITPPASCGATPTCACLPQNVCQGGGGCSLISRGEVLCASA